MTQLEKHSALYAIPKDEHLSWAGVSEGAIRPQAIKA